MSKSQSVVFREALVDFAMSGDACHWLGIIVTPALMKALQRDRGGVDTDTFQVYSTEGNQTIRYMFYILEDPSMPKTNTNGFFMTHFAKEAYEKEILGHIPDVLAQSKEKFSIAGTGITVQEINHIWGVVELSTGSSSHYYYNVQMHEILDAIKSAVKANEPVWSAITFDNDGLVRNPPESHWLGSLTFNEDGTLQNSVFHGSYPYVYETDNQGHPTLAQLGRLLMEKADDGLWIVGVAIDGYGNLHRVRHPETGLQDPMAFGQIALRYFLPEEVFLFLGMTHKDEFEAIMALPQKNYWGSWYDPENLGRMHIYTATGPRNGNLITADFLDTRAKARELEVVFVEEHDIHTWSTLKESYFPKD